MTAVRAALYNSLASEGGGGVGKLSPWNPIELVSKSVNYKVVYSSARRQNSVAKRYMLMYTKTNKCI